MLYALDGYTIIEDCFRILLDNLLEPHTLEVVIQHVLGIQWSKFQSSSLLLGQLQSAIGPIEHQQRKDAETLFETYLSTQLDKGA